MKTLPPAKNTTDFTVNCIFVVLALIGLFLIPKLSLQLLPSPRTNQLTVSYSYPNAAPRLVEQEVTSSLESVFSGMKHLQLIRSLSKSGGGQIELTFDPVESIEKARFAIISRIRQVFSKLPKELSFPVVSLQGLFDNSDHLMVYALIGKGDTPQLHRMAEEQIVPLLSDLKGIDDIQFYGTSSPQWNLTYDRDLLNQLNVNASEITTAIHRNQMNMELGHFRFTGPSYSLFSSDQIPLAKKDGRLLYVNDVADVQLKQEPSRQQYRINGLKVLSMMIKADTKVNRLALVTEIREKMGALAAQQSEWQAILTSDSTEFLRKELRRIVRCTLASIGILLLFVLLTSRSFLYTSLILIVMLVNISISCIFYYGLGISLHLYSLIGITVSLGIVIDNSIVMVDQLKKHSSRQIFLAIFAATLTSIGAIILIFYLDSSQREALADFAIVFTINLLVSLVISLFYTPALFRAFSIEKNSHSKHNKWLRFLVRFNQIYAGYIKVACRFRPLLLLLLVLSFGLPLFLLPVHLDGNSDWVRKYNSTFGGRFYNSKVKPVTNALLGGSLRLFLKNRERFTKDKIRQRTALHVEIKLPEGYTIEQMDAVCQRLEQFVLTYEGIEQCQANVFGSKKASMVIYFEKAFEKTGMPLALKRELQGEVSQIGHADFEVFGIGRGFNNELEGERLNQHIILNGFHYESLRSYANRLEKNLLSNNRVGKVYVNSRASFYAGKAKERYFERPSTTGQAMHGIGVQKLSEHLQSRSQNQGNALSVYHSGQKIPLKLEALQNAELKQWDLIHSQIPTDSFGFARINQLTSIRNREGHEDIIRENQQYQLVVGYSFVGHEELAGQFHQANVKALRNQLPIGYSVQGPDSGFWKSEKQSKRAIESILLSIAMIFVIGSILFNSIRQSLQAILLIPFAYIGLFLSTYYFDFNFDQGGFAAFLLLSGLSVNAIFFINNEYNRLKRKHAKRNEIQLYLKAFHDKIIPISLMVLSTILGLLPFLLFGQKQAFWYALAICTIGGLLCSMIGLLLYLPAFYHFKKST